MNPSRARPSVVTQSQSPSKGSVGLTPTGDSRYTSVFLTPGVVKRSSIYNVKPINLPTGKSRVVRELLLKPFLQEFQLLSGFFAEALSFSEVALSASEGCVSFASMQLFEDQLKCVNASDYRPLSPSEFLLLFPLFFF